MFKIPSAKTVRKFLPMILFNVLGLVLVGIKLGEARMTSRQVYHCRPKGEIYCSPGSSLGPDPIPDSIRLDALLPVPDGFVSKAKESSAYTLGPSTVFGFKEYKRRLIAIVTPLGASEKEIDAELYTAARREYERGASIVRVVAFNPDGSTITSASQECGSLLFAPYGNWDRTEAIYFLSTYEAVIYHR